MRKQQPDKRKTGLILLAFLALTMASCKKNRCICEEKQGSYEQDHANGVVAPRQERVKYDYEVGESAMSPDGTLFTYTREYIEQQKAELEATGKFDCEWKYN